MKAGVLRVNGVLQAISCRVTGSWAAWTIVSATVNLAPGKNKVLRLESIGWGLSKVDELVVPSSTLIRTSP